VNLESKNELSINGSIPFSLKSELWLKMNPTDTCIIFLLFIIQFVVTSFASLPSNTAGEMHFMFFLLDKEKYVYYIKDQGMGA